jgi:hypothetical protein
MTSEKTIVPMNSDGTFTLDDGRLADPKKCLICKLDMNLIRIEAGGPLTKGPITPISLSYTTGPDNDQGRVGYVYSCSICD